MLCDGAKYEYERFIPSVNQTCGFVDAAPLDRFNLTCPDFKETFSYYCGCPNATQLCSVCPGGDSLGAPKRKIFGLENATCRDLDDIASLYPGKDECKNLTLANLTKDVKFDFDVAAYCRCGDTGLGDNCNLCANSSLVRPDVVIPNSGNFTCAELSDFARSVTDPTACTVIQEFARGCCDFPPACTVCDSDSRLTLPNRTVSFVENSTCEEVDTALLFSTNETCVSLTDSIPVSLSSWCGCEGAEPSDQCSFCPNGTMVTNSSSSAPSASMSCGDVEELSRHVTNAQYCQEAVAPVAAFCCSNSTERNNE